MPVETLLPSACRIPKKSRHEKIHYLGLIAAGMLSIQYCENNAKDAKETSDSLNKTKDTTSNAINTGGITVTNYRYLERNTT